MKKFEYKFFYSFTKDINEFIELLNDYGEKRWQVVHMIKIENSVQGSGLLVYLMREKL